MQKIAKIGQFLLSSIVVLAILTACTKEPETSNVFFVANTFTPDGNQFNSEFRPILSNEYTLDSYRLVVRNRNGETLFESLDVNVGWDGTFDSVLVPNAVYLWEIRFTESSSSEKQILTGYVTLLR